MVGFSIGFPHLPIKNGSFFHQKLRNDWSQGPRKVTGEASWAAWIRLAQEGRKMFVALCSNAAQEGWRTLKKKKGA